MRARTVCSAPGCPRPAVRSGRGSACAEHQRRRGRDWHRLALEVLAEAGFRCECGAPAVEVSHLDPVWAGFPEIAPKDRLRARCADCARVDDHAFRFAI